MNLITGDSAFPAVSRQNTCCENIQFNQFNSSKLVPLCWVRIHDETEFLRRIHLFTDVDQFILAVFTVLLP